MHPLESIAAAIVIGAVTSWITVQLSVRRFRQEKWWERKAEAYARIIEALHNFKAFNDKHLEASMRGREVPDDLDAKLRERSGIAHDEISRATDVGAFLISGEAVGLLRQFLKDSARASETTSWQQYLMDDLEATETCLSGMIAAAKKDLGTN